MSITNDEIMNVLRDVWAHDLLDSLRRSQERDSIMYQLLTQSGDVFAHVSWNPEVVPDYLKLPEGL